MIIITFTTVSESENRPLACNKSGNKNHHHSLKRNGSTSSLCDRNHENEILNEEEARRSEEPRPISNRGDILMTPLFLSSKPLAQKRNDIASQLAQMHTQKGHRKSSSDFGVEMVSVNVLSYFS